MYFWATFLGIIRETRILTLGALFFLLNFSLFYLLTFEFTNLNKRN